MAKKTVAVYDGSEGYIQRLMEYLNRKNDLWFEVKGFNDTAALEAFLDLHKVEILLFSMEELVEEEKDLEERYDRFIHHENVKEFIYFGERRNSRSQIRHISKYQSVEGILAELRDAVFSKEEQKDMVSQKAGQKRADLTCVYAPSGDSDMISIALKLSEMLSPQMRVLLIDMERFSLLPFFAGIEEGGSLSDLIYYYKTNPQRMRECLNESRRRYNNVDILLAPEDMEDLNELAEEKWPDFIQRIAESGGYDSVLVYMGEAFRNPEYLFDDCDVIYITMPEENNAKYKVSRFANYWVEKGRKDILDKAHLISVKRNPDAASEKIISGEMELVW